MQNPLPSPINYREDINGLRAWAVIAVLLFHFSLIGLSGGFAGVDLFFVISGYLMTAIIVNGYEKGSFSIWKFYMSRVRRIVPALLGLIAVLLILGWFYLPTFDYQSLGAESVFGLSFLSNIYYWTSAGYFDTAAESKWLLHTWSLAVEAQFYVLYPIFLALVWKFWKSIKAINYAIIILFVGSLILNLYASERFPGASFYLLPTRGWELASGGLVFLAIRYNLFSNSFKNIGYWLGWILIIGSFSFITKDLAWPSYWAIFPVLGTSLVLLANKNNVVFTNNYVAQWIGDRSYSLYLWHWPIVVALNFAILQYEWIWVIGGFVLSILLAQLSYRFVEIPTRQYLTQSSLKKEVFTITFVGLIVILGAVSIKFFTFDGRIDSKIEFIANEAYNDDPRKEECLKNVTSNGSPGCVYGNSKLIGAYLFGDSHAGATVTSIRNAGIKYNKNTQFYGMGACAPIRGIKNVKFRAGECYPFNNWLFDEQVPKLIKNVPIVLISRTNQYTIGANEFNEKNEPFSYFDKPFTDIGNSKFLNQFKDAYIKTACEISVNHPVYLVRPIPEMGINVPTAESHRLILGLKDNTVKISVEDYHKRNKLVWEIQDEAVKQCGAKILNPLPYLCDDEYCYGSKNGMPLYFDDDHLSEYGNKLLVPMFEEIFKDEGK